LTLRAAAEYGVGERTVGLWMADEAFRRRVGDLRGEMVAAALVRMTRSMTSAADTLRRLLKSSNGAVALGSATTLIELTLKLCDAIEMEARVAAIEESIKARNAT
jgi:hypothetical protein